MVKLLSLITIALSVLGVNKSIIVYELKNNYFQNNEILYNATEKDFNNNVNSELYDNENSLSADKEVKDLFTSIESDIYVSNEKFLYNYFYHLTDNKLQNNIGICGYTAITMFLTYYDSYWNDNFIDEKYESEQTKINSSDLYSNRKTYQSPGVKNTLSS